MKYGTDTTRAINGHSCDGDGARFPTFVGSGLTVAARCRSDLRLIERDNAVKLLPRLRTT